MGCVRWNAEPNEEGTDEVVRCRGRCGIMQVCNLSPFCFKTVFKSVANSLGLVYSVSIV